MQNGEMRHIKLFLSAVSNEFCSYREYLRPLLTRDNVIVCVQEDFIPTGTETLDKLDRYVAQCDAVIHLVGDMTGSWARSATLQDLRARYSNLADRLPPLKPSLDFGEPPLSYTQWEAYLAVYHGKPLIIAVPEPETPRDEKYQLEADQQTSQQAHLKRLRALGHHDEIKFKTADQLAVRVLRSAIYDLLVEAGVVSPIMNVFKVIHEVANLLSARRERLARAERQRKTDMANLFERISGTLMDVSCEIRAGNLPHGKCGLLIGYAQELPDKVREEVGRHKAKEYGRTLSSAYNVEGAAMGLQPAETEPYLKEIEEASGKFQALANLVRA